jgi:rhamnogalacturonan endolyase
VIAAWDWDGKQLRQHWIFDTNTPEWNGYASQGNHNLRVADVDGDGCDEITYGSMAVDNDGRGLYNTGLGHGDAMHLTVFDPKSSKLQVWDCHEKHNNGSDFRDAATGKILFHLPANGDVGRCMAADIDPTNPGVEMWSSASGGIRNIKGEVVVPKNPTDNYDQRIEEYWRQNPPMPNKADTAHAAASHHRLQGMSTNFGIWWDGDLLRELLDHEMVIKYDWNSGQCNMVKHFDGCKFNNWTKSNPCLSADIIGDWREEVLTRNDESTELRLYVSTIPTDYRINCLEEDIPYRLSVATENVAYNQPPETGFYLGPDKTKHPFLK